MRPRGESISSPSSRYVGQAFRQSPQWTQRSRSNCLGPKPGFSDTAIQSATVQKVGGVKQVLDAPHDFQIAARGRPQLERMLALFRRKLDDSLPSAPGGAGEPACGGVGLLEVAITDSRTSARQRRAFERSEDAFQLSQGTRSAHNRAIGVPVEESRCKAFHVLPEGLGAAALDRQAAGDVRQLVMVAIDRGRAAAGADGRSEGGLPEGPPGRWVQEIDGRDRKSTRLNSSHAN